MVVLVQLVDVQATTASVHINAVLSLSIHRALDLNSLCSVSLLRVQLTTIHRFNMHNSSIAALRVRS